MKEKRTVPRFKIPVKVEYSNATLHNAREEGVCEDFNLNGMRLVAKDKIGTEQFLDLYLHFPGNPCKASGRVVWEKDSGGNYQAGISFLNMEEPVRKYLLNYIFDHVTDEFQKKYLNN